MHACVKCFMQRRIQALVTHTHPPENDNTQWLSTETPQHNEAQNPLIIRSKVVPAEQHNPPPQTPKSGPQLSEQDLTPVDKATLMSAYTSLTTIQEAASSRAPYAHFYDVLADKTRQRGQDVLLEALDRKSSS